MQTDNRNCLISQNTLSVPLHDHTVLPLLLDLRSHNSIRVRSGDGELLDKVCHGRCKDTDKSHPDGCGSEARDIPAHVMSA